MRSAITVATVLGILGYAGVTLAFPFPYLYHEPAAGDASQNRAGAGGIYKTNGKQDFGIKCSDCHTNGAGTIGVSLTIIKLPSSAATGWDVVGGADGYEPGATYQVQVDLTGQHLFAATNMDTNGMVATFEDQSGNLAGVLTSDSGQTSSSCPSTYPFPGVHKGPGGGATTVLFGDCHAVISFLNVQSTTWNFEWTAPSAGTGDVTLHLGVVDGDTGGSSSLDDDTVERSFVLVEGP